MNERRKIQKEYLTSYVEDKLTTLWRKIQRKSKHQTQALASDKTNPKYLNITQGT